jgi:hypothetical protein
VAAPERARFLVGVVCVAVAASLAIRDVPRTLASSDARLRSYAYLTGAQDRLLTTGDGLGIPRALQVAALTEIPPRSPYAFLFVSSQEAANRRGIAPITYETVAPWLRYLLLPSEPVSPGQARYVICWLCETSRWQHRVVWLWRADPGMAVGRVTR